MKNDPIIFSVIYQIIKYNRIRQNKCSQVDANQLTEHHTKIFQKN